MVIAGIQKSSQIQMKMKNGSKIKDLYERALYGLFFNSLKNRCKSTNKHAIIQTKGVEHGIHNKNI